MTSVTFGSQDMEQKEVMVVSGVVSKETQNEMTSTENCQNQDVLPNQVDSEYGKSGDVTSRPIVNVNPGNSPATDDSFWQRINSSQSICEGNDLSGQPVETCYADSWGLDSLPSEILLHILSFLDAQFVICTMAKVCSTFHHLINDTSFWKVRIKKRWPKKYPALPVKDCEFDWKKACVERETLHQRFSDVANNLEYVTYREGIFGAVDSVHLMENGNLLAIGSRDRYLNLLDLRKLDDSSESSSDCRIFCKGGAHDGWIWSINSCGETLATGSWDTRIKFWDLTTMTPVHEARGNSAILCSHFEQNFYVAGSYDKNIYHIDPRAAAIICKKRYHLKPVLCLAANDRYIISGSEDSTVAVYDRRASTLLKKLKLNNYPTSMSYDGDELWVGDKTGSIHLLDASDGDIYLSETCNIGHVQMVTGIIHTLGALFTCSTDRTVKVLEPSLSPSLIVNLTDIAAEVAKISYQDGVLACASSGMFVGIYRPKTCRPTT